MGKRGSAGGKRASGGLHGNPSSVGSASTASSNYGSIIAMSTLPAADRSILEETAQRPPPSKSDGKNNIWEEYYPLIQPAHQYHHNGRGASNYFFHGMFSSDVLCAYRDAVLAYLVALFSMVVLSITGLVFCKEWGIESTSPIVFACRSLWTISPAIASLALRNSAYILFCSLCIFVSVRS